MGFSPLMTSVQHVPPWLKLPSSDIVGFHDTNSRPVTAMTYFANHIPLLQNLPFISAQVEDAQPHHRAISNCKITCHPIRSWFVVKPSICKAIIAYMSSIIK